MEENKKLARRYDREFKQDAVTLVQSGRAIKEVARDLGISDWSLPPLDPIRQSRAGPKGARYTGE